MNSTTRSLGPMRQFTLCASIAGSMKFAYMYFSSSSADTSVRLKTTCSSPPTVTKPLIVKCTMRVSGGHSLGLTLWNTMCAIE